MSEPNVPPDLLAKLESLTRRVYELERRRIEGSASGASVGDPILFATPSPATNVAEFRSYLGTTVSNAAEMVFADGTFNNDTTPFPDLVPDNGAYLNFLVEDNSNYYEMLAGPDNSTGFWEQYLIRTDAARTGGGMDGYAENDAGTRYAGGEITADTNAFGSRADAFIGTDVQDADADRSGSFVVQIRSDDVFEWSLNYNFDGIADRAWWYFGATGGAASVAFGIFDQGPTPSGQAAGIDMSAESAAVQAIYAGMRGYGWFGP